MSEPAEVGTEALDLLTYDEVAVKLRVSVKTVRRLVDSGELESLTVGARSRRIAPEAVIEYKTRLRGAASGNAPAA